MTRPVLGLRSWLAAPASGRITQFDHTEFKTHFAAEVKDFDPARYVDKQDARRMDRFLHFAAAATQEALADAGFDMSHWIRGGSAW